MYEEFTIKMSDVEVMSWSEKSFGFFLEEIAKRTADAYFEAHGKEILDNINHDEIVKIAMEKVAERLSLRFTPILKEVEKESGGDGGRGGGCGGDGGRVGVVGVTPLKPLKASW
jgi:hypothetical protein